MRILIVLLFLVNCFSSQAQTPGIGLGRNFGGTESDRFTSNAITRTGELVHLGTTRSNDGDAANTHGGSDGLLVVTSKTGHVLWQKLIGGSNDEDDAAVDTLTDGNFVIGLGTRSTDGDIQVNKGHYDILLQKYTPTGSLVWSKTYGGSGSDLPVHIKATPDGGFIVLGKTTSNASGDVGPGYGNLFDIWVIKVDASGNIQWQKTYGGSGNEDVGEIALSGDGGYYIAVHTNSSDGNLAGLLPAGTQFEFDIWLFKIDATGNIGLSKMIGGSAVEESPSLQVSQSSIYVSFSTRSTDRDISFPNMGLHDIAVFKFNKAGTVLWKKTYGGAAWDSPHVMAASGDGLTLTGVTYSFIFNGVSGPNLGDGDALLIRLDSATGNMRWFKRFGGNNRDFARDFKIDNDGTVYMSGSSLSNQHDVQQNYGEMDAVIWSSNPKNRISGMVFIDNNSNGTFQDFLDKSISYVPVQAFMNGNLVCETLTWNGRYIMELDEGIYEVKIKQHADHFIATPASFTKIFTTTSQVYERDIILSNNGVKPDLAVYTAPLGPARVAFQTDYLLLAYNRGNQVIPNVTLSYKRDPRVNYSGFSIPPATQTSDSVTWNINSFEPFDSLKIIISVTTPAPPMLNTGDILTYHARIFPVSGDVVPADNYIIRYNPVVGPLDPNDKTNLRGNKMTIAELQASGKIDYIIRFQNVGTAEAINVVIKDTINDDFDLNSIEVMAASHAFKYQLSGSVATFTFPFIHLQDSTTNEPASHGYIGFRIKPKTNLAVGTAIKNKAAIYFDYEAPVITNTDTVKIIPDMVTGINEPAQLIGNLKLFPNPATGNIVISSGVSTNRIQMARLYHSSGLLCATVFPGTDTYSWKLPLLPAGNYYVLAYTKEGRMGTKLVVIQ